MTPLTDAVMASWAAYYEQGLDKASPHPEALGYTDVRWLPGRRGFTGVRNGVFTAAIAGTRSLGDFITDVRCLKVLSGKMAIHQGFFADTAEILDAVKFAYFQALTKDPHIVVLFTGHSLGGAVAAIMSRLWSWSDLALVTFGQPYTGDKVYAVTPANVATSIRVKHDRDLITTLPPSNLGFFHSDKLLHLASDGSQLRWWHRLFRWATRDLPLIEDHPIRFYAAAVTRYERTP